MRLVINIPCYNEEKTLPLVLKDIPKKIKGISSIVVQVLDDGSSDKTVAVARKFGVHVLKNKHNMGLGVTFRRGINEALKNGADIIVNIDGDGQFNPKDIPKLIEPILSENADMVTCTRFKDPSVVKNMPFIKKIGNKVFTRIVSSVTGKKFTDTQCGFRAYSREAALKLNLFGKFTYTQEVFLDLVEKGMNIVEMPLPVVYHNGRKSKMVKSVGKYSFKSLGIILRAVRDTNPLVFFGIPAWIIFSIGFLGGLFSFIFWTIVHLTSPVKTLFLGSIFLMIIGGIVAVLALMSDMIRRMRLSNEEVLYRLKKKEYER